MLTDQFGNQVQTLTSACVNSLGVSGPGLDKSNLKITWQVFVRCHTVYLFVHLCGNFLSSVTELNQNCGKVVKLRTS